VPVGGGRGLRPRCISPHRVHIMGKHISGSHILPELLPILLSPLGSSSAATWPPTAGSRQLERCLGLSPRARRHRHVVSRQPDIGRPLPDRTPIRKAPSDAVPMCPSRTASPPGWLDHSHAVGSAAVDMATSSSLDPILSYRPHPQKASSHSDTRQPARKPAQAHRVHSP
jgi:hypothetical protein